MKSIRKSAYILTAGLFFFAACDIEESGPTISTEPTPPSITSPDDGDRFTLTEDQAESDLMTVEWTKADFGFSSATSYRLEMGLPGDNFENPVQLTQTNTTAFTTTVGDMNNRLLSAGIVSDQESSVQFRVRASVSSSVESIFSDPIGLGFTPYEVEINYPEVYVPGGYQGASGYGNDWTPEDAPPLASLNSDDNYEGYVYFVNANTEFKFTDERSWDLNWGDDGADGTLDQNGANIVAADAGYYKLNVDLNGMTYEILNTTWGVIGDATPGGWDADQDMTYDAGSQVWTITVDLTEGEMKFRANDDWALNYGDDNGNGKLNRDGGNIAVSEAGNYTIELNLSTTPEYTYTLTLN